ncbi:unnamed protein product [Lactuca saligna]|uniref:Uncharacterized protein n=1 Tax=Lactuca saligna TaxID=75948 RepID=A0AA35ZCH3_LACSI|nr:unnamed protein product [Lactuca saligna]
MFASLPRFSKPEIPTLMNRSLPTEVDRFVSPPNSYSNVVTSALKDKLGFDKVDDIIHITSWDFIVEISKHACLVKARDFLTLPNLWMLCFDEGFEDFDIRYVSDFWAMLGFRHKEACRNFLASDVMDHWMVEKRP